MQTIYRDLDWTQNKMRSDVIVGYCGQRNVVPCARMWPFRNLLLLHLYIYHFGIDRLSPTQLTCTISVYPCPSQSIPAYLRLCLPISVSLFLSPSIPAHLRISLPISVSLCLSPSIPAYLNLSQPCLSPSISYYSVYLCSFYHCLVSLSSFIHDHLFNISFSVFIYYCLSLSISVSFCLSSSLSAYLLLSLPIIVYPCLRIIPVYLLRPCSLSTIKQ